MKDQYDALKPVSLIRLSYVLFAPSLCLLSAGLSISLCPVDLPGPPSSVSLFVTSASSLFVSIREPTGIATGLITRYRGGVLLLQL